MENPAYIYHVYICIPFNIGLPLMVPLELTKSQTDTCKVKLSKSFRQYKKEDVVWLPKRQLSTKDQNDTDINNYTCRSPYVDHYWGGIAK